MVGYPWYKNERPKVGRINYNKSLKESLTKAVKLLSCIDEVKKVSLVGFFSRGRADLFTYLDIVLITRKDQGILARMRTLYPMLNLPLSYDPFLYTPHEMKECRNSPLLKQIISNEVILYEKEHPRRRGTIAGTGL